jgi:predicted TIM-barrel fold metal-dependent hydrolase
MMDRTGISGAVLLQNPAIGDQNDYIRQTLVRCPDRFRGTIQVDPTSPYACHRIEHYASPHQNALKLELSEDWGWSGIYGDLPLDGPVLEPVWETVLRLGLRMIIDPGPVSGKGYQVENIANVAAMYPSVPILVEHLGYMTGEDYVKPFFRQRWRRMLSLGREFGNVFFGTSAVCSLMGEPYPCPGTKELMREGVEMVSADKLLWGSDVPTTLKDYTYVEMVEFITRECDFIPAADMEKIMGLNAARFFDFY